MILLNSHEIENPVFGARFSTVSLLSCGKISVKIPKIPNFWLPWQQWLITFNDIIKWSDLENPRNAEWCKILGYISCVSRVVANLPLKFPNFGYHGNKGRFEVNFNGSIRFSAHDFLKGVGYFGCLNCFHSF